MASVGPHCVQTTAAPGSGPCPHARRTDWSAGSVPQLRPLPFPLLPLGLIEACPPQQRLPGVPPSVALFLLVSLSLPLPGSARRGQEVQRALHAPSREYATTRPAPCSGLPAERFLVPGEEDHMWRRMPQVTWLSEVLAQRTVPTVAFPGKRKRISETPGEKRVSSGCLSFSSCLSHLPNT